MTGRHMSFLLDVQTGSDMGVVGKKLSEQIELWGRDGYQPRSVSHACDPEAEAGERWSVLTVFERVATEAPRTS
jgi:hypothetical protein